MFTVKKGTLTAIIAAGLTCAALVSCTNNTANNNKPVVDRTPLNSTIEAQPEKAHFTFMEHSQDTPNLLQSTDKQTIYISSSAEKVSFVAENRADREAARKINEVLTQAHERNKDIYYELSDDLDKYLSAGEVDMSTFPWETSVDYTCVRNDGKAISVIEVINSLSAGNHIGTTAYSYNFDPVTGDNLSQVFYTIGDKESFDKADDVMYKKLVAKYGEETISYDNVSSSFVEEAQACWYFTQDGVMVTFNAGSIADPEAGVLELEYSKEELPELAQKYFN